MKWTCDIYSACALRIETQMENRWRAKTQKEKKGRTTAMQNDNAMTIAPCAIKRSALIIRGPMRYIYIYVYIYIYIKIARCADTWEQRSREHAHACCFPASSTTPTQSSCARRFKNSFQTLQCSHALMRAAAAQPSLQRCKSIAARAPRMT